MTELKTLKDLPCAEGEDDFWHTNHIDIDTPRCIDENILKAEAVKWCKYWNQDMFMKDTITEKELALGRIEAMKTFFNLTDEDLK